MNSAAFADRMPGGGALRRWVLVALLVHFGLVYMLGNRHVADGRVPPTDSRASLIWLAEGAQGVSALPGGAVLAEVSVAGFSGALWRGGDAVWWSEVLRADGGGLAGAIPVRGPSFTNSPLGGAARWRSRGGLWLAAVEEATTKGRPFSAGSSRLLLGGSVASLTLAQPPEVPGWTNADVLLPTSVQLLVDEGGNVLSASVLPPGSGLAAADAQALRLARGLQFQPRGSGAVDAPGQGWVWGTAEFGWHTLEPAKP